MEVLNTSNFRTCTFTNSWLQIWMVLLEDDTLITSFPQRWGHTKLNEGNASKLADMAGIISKELSNELRQPLTSAHDMILLILDTVTNALFNSSAHRNEKLQFFEFFERKIQEVVSLSLLLQ